MEIGIRDALIPVDLRKNLEEEIYNLWLRGAPVNEAIRAGVKTFNDYWKKRDTGKNGA